VLREERFARMGLIKKKKKKKRPQALNQSVCLVQSLFYWPPGGAAGVSLNLTELF
jgi:hypothetical protein